MVFHIFSSDITQENEVSSPIRAHHTILQEKVDSHLISTI